MSASDCPAAIRRGMSARIAWDCDELLSKTAWPSQTGQASWCSSRVARASGESAGRERTTNTTTPASTTIASAHHDHSLCDFTSGLALLPGPRRLEPYVELGLGRRSEVPAHRDAVGRDDVGLGLTGRSEAQRRLAVRVDADRPGDALAPHVAAHRRRVVVDDDADHREIGLGLVLGVERLHRRRLLQTRDAPAVEEVDDVRLALQVRRRDRLAVQALQRE